MRNGHFRKASIGLLMCMTLLLAGCSMRAKYQRTVRLSAPLSPGSTFEAQTHNGSITTNGADVADCNMVATITARAATEEEARELAEQVEISLEPSNCRLIFIRDRKGKITQHSTGIWYLTHFSTLFKSCSSKVSSSFGSNPLFCLFR